LSEDIRILLKGFYGKGQANDTARDVVFKQPMLMGFQKKPLHSLAGQEEQLPINKIKQFGPRWLVLLQVKRDVREGLQGQVGWGNAFVDRSLKDAKITEC
jgi:hypothetical protein